MTNSSSTTTPPAPFTPATPAKRALPTKVIVGLTLSAILLITAVTLELVGYFTKNAILTEQVTLPSDHPLLQPAPAGAVLPTVQDLAPAPPPPQAPPGLTRPGAPAASAPGGSGTPGADPVARGAQLVNDHKCLTCHSTDGQVRISTSFLRMYGKQSKLADGSTVTVDDAYIRESILNPTAKIVAGPSAVMPPYAGQLSDADIDAIIAYIQSLR